MDSGLVCWRCGASLAELSLPLLRHDECRQCRAQLHVCKLCVDYDPHVGRQCREPTAEDVHDKERANFCGHFKPRPGAFVPGRETANDAARAELDKLFGK